MKKKTKKAANKPRPKTVTLRQWRVVNKQDGWLSSEMTKRVAGEMAASYGEPYCAARVTITYEVRR